MKELEELKVPAVVQAKFERNPEILEEFLEAARAGEFPDKVSYEGYTASKIAEVAPFMNTTGVYSFLVTLKENPEMGLGYIREGFPRR